MALPSLLALELFVLAARFESISRAAEKIGLTQSAASRRLAALEEQLGIALLERRRHGVSATEAGKRLLDEIEPALNTLAGAMANARKAQAEVPLKLRVYSTFAAHWLLPRLPDFEKRHPDIRVSLDTTVTPILPQRGKVDLAIQFGEGTGSGETSWLLMEDEIEPVCSPDFAHRHGLCEAQQDLSGIRLLDARYRRADWTDWAGANGCDIGRNDTMRFPSSLLAFQAAEQGLGLAMGQTRLLAAELRNGTLVAPFARPLRRPLGYFLMAPSGPEPEQARAFRRWILAVCAPTATHYGKNAV